MWDFQQRETIIAIDGTDDTGVSRQDPGLSLGSVDYPSGFYHEQAPVHLNYVCALNGTATPNLADGFRYCELGCGAGETTCILAAAYPRSEFVGIDLSQTHIEAARGLAQSGRLENAEFIVADLQSYDARDLASFDYITLHGLYSWVSADVRRGIRAFITDKLKIGGLVYVSYNAMPGWGAAAPLRRFFVDTAPRLEGDLVERARQIIAMLVDLQSKGTPLFAETPTASRVLERLTKSDIRYVAHEFLGTNWEPLYFADLNREMESTGLRFVGHAEILGNFPSLSVVPDLPGNLLDFSDRTARESICDFVMNRFFRRDVFIRADENQPELCDDDNLKSTLFGFLVSAEHAPDSIKWAGGNLSFTGAWFDRLKKLLAYRVLSLSDLLQDPILKNCPKSDLVTGIKQLTIGGFFAPFAGREVEPPGGPAEKIRLVPKINEILLDRYDWAGRALVLASPVVGSGVALNSLEAALLGGLRTNDPVSWVFSELDSRGVAIQTIDEGAPIKDEAESRKAISRSLEQFQAHKLPKLAYFGVVDAA